MPAQQRSGGQLPLWLGENLGHADERMLRIPADAPLPEPLQPLLVVVLVAEEPSMQAIERCRCSASRMGCTSSTRITPD